MLWLSLGYNLAAVCLISIDTSNPNICARNKLHAISSSRIRKIIKEEKCPRRVAIVTSQLALVFC